MLGIDPLYLLPLLLFVVILAASWWRGGAPGPQRAARAVGLAALALSVWSLVVGELETAVVALIPAAVSFGLLAVAARREREP